MPESKLRAVSDRLAAIEQDLREVAGVADPLVRRILTSILRRQADYHRDLLRTASTDDGPSAGGDRRH